MPSTRAELLYLHRKSKLGILIIVELGGRPPVHKLREANPFFFHLLDAQEGTLHLRHCENDAKLLKHVLELLAGQATTILYIGSLKFPAQLDLTEQ